MNIVNAWIELKAIESWPKRAATNVAIDHYTPQQRVWLYRRWRTAELAAPLNKWELAELPEHLVHANEVYRQRVIAAAQPRGRTYLLLEVVQASEWLLFEGDVAARHVAKGTQAQHRARARLIASNPQPIAEFFRT